MGEKKKGGLGFVSMNQELAEVIRRYATTSLRELNQYLIDKSKNTILAILTDLITIYMNDKNSSLLREFLTVTIAGYTHTITKIGYNGYKQSSIVKGKTINCEAKPKNVETEEHEKYRRGERKSRPYKLNGGGNFTDYTFKRFEKDLDEDLNMLVSGFVDGKLIYILEFPFKYKPFVNKLKRQLIKRFPEGDQISEYLRGANFYYRDYIECEELKMLYLPSRGRLEEFKEYISRDFYEFLLERAEDD